MPSDQHLLQSAFHLIQKAERILLVSDGKPDGDSIGSTTAMLSWLLREKSQVETFCIESIPTTLRFIDQVHRVTSDQKIFAHPFDLILTFDASDPKRCGLTDNLCRLPSPCPIIVFDHHVTNPRYGDLNLIFTDACSTCEVVYRFFMENGVKLDAHMATSLFTGITTDTSSFINGSTNVTGIQAAAHCIQSGARYTDIIKNIIHNKSLEGLKLWGLALARLRLDKQRDLATTYFLADELKSKATEEAIEGLSNFLSAVCRECDTILVLRDKGDGTVRGSFRSHGRDISKLAQLLGGGGHKKAAGFTMKGRIEITPSGVRIAG